MTLRLRRVRDRTDREYAQPLDVEALARGVNRRSKNPPTPLAPCQRIATRTRLAAFSGVTVHVVSYARRVEEHEPLGIFYSRLAHVG